MRSSPQPTAQRLFTVLLTVLLVSSLAAPFAAGPVVADDDDGTYAYYCEPLEVGITEPMCERTVTDVASDETMMHSTAVAEAEAMDAHYTMLDNHLQDTSTIASIEARHAIAQSWEDGDSETEAYQAAMEAIRDYYATHQENHVQAKARTLAQMGNVQNASEVDDDVVHPWISAPKSVSTGEYNHGYVQSETAETSVELVNGETHNFTTPTYYIEIRDGSDVQTNYRLTVPLNYGLDDDKYEGVDFSDGEIQLDLDFDFEEPPGYEADRNGANSGFDLGMTLHTVNVGDIEDGGLPSETVFDGEDWRDRWSQIEHQSDQAVANYDVGFVEALYDEMDAGRLDPEEVRGAEGMVRHLSGDSEVTDQRFQLALMQMSGMSNPDLAGTSSMTVEYEGYTDITYNGTDGDQRVPELSGHTEGTFEGLLFASEVPEGGFETNQTYAVGDVNLSETDAQPVNGSAQIFDSTEGETTHFYGGEFTVTGMYDADGEQVETVEWDQPKYDTYNASEFAEYIEEVQDLRDALEEQGGADDGISIGWPDFGDGDVDGGTALIGLVIIVIVAIAIIGLVTDLLPWF